MADRPTREPDTGDDTAVRSSRSRQPAARSSNQLGTSRDWRRRLLLHHVPPALASALVLALFLTLPLLAGGDHAESRDHGEDQHAVEDSPATGTLLVWVRAGLPDDLAGRVAGLPDVDRVPDSDRAIVSTVRRGLVHLTRSWSAAGTPIDDIPGGFVVPLQAMAVGASAHVPFTPDPYGTLLAGLDDTEVVLGATAARLRQVDVGGALEIGEQRLTVAGVVPDEVVGSAEVLLTLNAAEEVGGLEPDLLLLRHSGIDGEVAAEIEALLPDGTAARIRPIGNEPSGAGVALPEAAVKERFGEFSYRPPTSGRRFVQDPAWVGENIVTRTVPIVGKVTCHRDFIPFVAGALGELEERGLAHLIDLSDFAGCWSPRLIDEDRGLSRHAWGIAIDFNASTNPFGEEPRLDRRVVETLRRWGMAWGGDFLVPDGMHFEFLEQPGP